jgi:O-succinylbenzoic acid--CoA ligase
MTRALVAVDPAEPRRVLAALRDALSGDGPAVFPGAESPAGSVAQRVALVVETSGSTGRPKRVVLSADAVLASAAASESALGGPGQWLLALPVHYIAGLNVLARSITAQTDPVVMAAGRFSVEGFVDAAASLTDPTRFVSLVPAQLSRLLDAVDSAELVLDVLRRFDRILVGGQATPTALVARALELGLNLTRSYGSAETCGGCVYDGVPIGDAVVRTVATSGRSAGTGPSGTSDGRIELGGPMLAEGYLDDPARTDAAFRTDEGRRWYRTDDRGVLVDGVLRVTGRIDDVIVSGGVKVSLGEVELVVRGMPGQTDAVVVAVPSEWGESAVVVTEVAVELEAVRLAVAGELGAAASPLRIVLVDRLPRTSTGKPDRVAATALALS